MSLRKSTRIWLAILGAGIGGILLDRAVDGLGAAGDVGVLLVIVAGNVVFWRAVAVAFRVVIHRLTLRLAFSYFLIGILPIPLLGALFAAVGYLLANQIIATRLRAEVNILAELARASGSPVPQARIGSDGRVTTSDVAWLPPGEAAPWAAELTEAHPLIAGDRVWIAIRNDTGQASMLRLIPIQDRSAPWLQSLADRTGWDVTVELGSGERTTAGYQIRVQRNRSTEASLDARFVSPRLQPPPSASSVWRRKWLGGVYVDRAVAVIGKTPSDRPVVAFLARTSPATLLGQLFAQGVPEVSRVLRVIFLTVAAALLCVYLVALTIAFVLVGSIVRNVNRLTRATEAIANGDFSVRVQSKSRDQIGDLARSFDGMAASIQKLLQDTARKEKLEAELAVARAIQESFLPESGEPWKGFQAVAHFEPVADLGGDYYDILPMPDGRTAVAIGDVSGHGLPTGFVAAAVRASLATFIELGVPASEAFVRLGRRTQRSHDSERRLYTTLALFAYDATRRKGTLTNAGHPAPYRIQDGRVERLELAALPIGLLPGRPASFASKEFLFEPGDRLVFFTDGIVEAADAAEEPYGYERLEALLAREGRRPAEEIIASILAAVASHVGGHPLEDDRTLLVVTFDSA